ncbi:hypothetical protein BTO04_03490 [Polaribacter sp. SA4-10]|uniref:hypothetical protein n=1 Tax=Polaribacter sp. SA4-10 TaxID=754397 RepID=UPI000B3C3D82|nr:hypothetical protein [Polaribacter sp. SA4-10]ARV05817.1 hypothetical protein BTO04_03490 [Polaribacter sp. SA4-10]
MLSKQKCTHAINVWKETRTDFSKVKKIIDPTAVFNFTQDDCDWIKGNNENSNFHTYVGVHNDKFILIVVPLDKKGKEIDLDSYLTTKLTDLKEDITLIETDVVTTVSKTTLSKNLEITKHWKEVDLPTYNEPTITERASVKDIEKWKNECLDWFYYECNKAGGKNIFRVFTVPFADLAREGQKQGEVVALFGFKHSSIYQTQIPILIFVAIADKAGTTEIMRAKNNEGTSETNTEDLARPCPPLCKEKSNFTLLD